jgi:PST family polysaccharide transporter
MTDKAVRLLVGLVINVWMVRYLGAGPLGLLSFTQSVVAIVAIVSQLGLEGILVRDLVRRPQDEPALLGSALGLRLAGAAVTLVIGTAAVALLRPGVPAAAGMALVFASLYAFQALDVIDQWFQSRTQVAPSVVARAVAFALASLAKIAALLAHASLVWLAAAIVSEFVFAALALVVAYRLRRPGAPRWRFEPATARALLAASWPLMLNGAATLLLIRIDQAMLTLIRGEHENGIYSAAQRLTEILFFVPIAISNAAAPALLGSHARDAGEYARRLERYFTILVWIALAIALPASLLAGRITLALFGAAFRDSGPVLALHIWSLPGLFMGVAITNWFVAEERQRELMLRSVLGATLNVALNLVLIPAWGARGAAAATIVAQTFAYFLVNAVFPNTRALFRMQCRALWPVPPAAVP